MPHVVTQSCVGDGSCVFACPVNCIQPTPDDPAFELAEMLHIDPATCVDCGACVAACPVDAIKPHAALSEDEQAFAALNASYHAVPRKRSLLAPIRPPLVVRDRGEVLRVAIVGSGPAAMYAAEEVLTIPGAQVDVYERLPRSYGLVRSGVAPDHRRTRRVSRHLDHIAGHERLAMHLGVEIGRDITQDELRGTHHAVIHGVGAASDRRLQIPGADLPGVLSATELVAWYNGHPDHADRRIDLSHPRAVVVGNGNVALDVARILTADPDVLADTDIAPGALVALRGSRIEEVVVVARRGPEHSAFTLPELIGLQAAAGVTLGVVHGELGDAPTGDLKLDRLRALPEAEAEAEAEGAGAGRRVTLRYGLSPAQVLGSAAVEGVAFARSLPDPAATSGTETVEAGLLLTSIGYRGVPVRGLPFDTVNGTVPNEDGRVIDPADGTPVGGAYVVGWIKRGPSGFIGTNKACAQSTVATLVDDYNAGRLPAPSRPGPPPSSARRPSRRRRAAASLSRSA